MAKYVYFFGDGKAEGRGDMKNLLGGKGANLAEMTSIGLPVPAGSRCRPKSVPNFTRTIASTRPVSKKRWRSTWPGSNS